MQSNGNYRFLENFGEDERYFNDNIAAVIDSDYVMNYLNNPEANQRRQDQMFGQVLPDIQYSYNSFPDSYKPPENLQNLYGKLNMQEPLMMGNIGEPNKIQFAHTPTSSYKAESLEDIDGNVKVKKMKTNKESEVRKVSESSKSKNNIKNTYINKINSLHTTEKPAPAEKPAKIKAENPLKAEAKRSAGIKNEDHNSPEESERKNSLKKVRSCDVLKSDDLEKLNVKLAKNRESARNSRIRKKVYIDLLEKTVEQLQNELNSTKTQLETNTTNFPKVIYQAKPVSNLFTARGQLFERLEKMLNNKADESEISFLVDSLRLRFGASGKDRVDVVNYMFKQILEYLVPVHMRYLLWIAGQGKDLFNTTDNQPNSFFIGAPTNDNTEYYNELITQMNVTEKQKTQMLRHKKKLLAEKQKFETLVSNLNQARKSVLKQATNLQAVIDEFRNYLSPSQTAKLLLILEREKNRKEFRPELLWGGITMKKESHSQDDDGSDDSDNFLEGDEGSIGDYDDGSVSSGSQKLMDMTGGLDFMDMKK